MSTNLDRNSFDLLSTIINYENNQRYPWRGGQPDRQSARDLRRAGNHEEDAELYDKNLPPPAYEVRDQNIHSAFDSNHFELFRVISNSLLSLSLFQDIIRNDELKMVTVESSSRDIELRELNQETRRKLSNGPLPEESSNHSNYSNHANDAHNHIARLESSSETSLEATEPTVSNRGLLSNGPVSSDSFTSQPSEGSSHSHQQTGRMNRSQSDHEQPAPNQPNQLNQSNEQLPTYEQAVQANRQNGPV